MAVIVFSSLFFTSGIRMGSQDFSFALGNGTGIFTPTGLVFTDGANTATFLGTNLQTTVIAGHLIDISGGNFTDFSANIGGTTAMGITGWNVSAATFFDLAVAKNWPQLWNLIVSGNDDIFGTTFNDRLIGGAGNDTLHGDRGHDVLLGGGGRDLIAGGMGHDTLTGGTGVDMFIFDAPLNAAHSDRILDFTSGQDRIVLDDDTFTVLPTGGLSLTRFALGTSAGDSSDRLIYDQPTGDLFYDRDGTGSAAQVLIANLGAGTTLHHTDFLIVP